MGRPDEIRAEMKALENEIESVRGEECEVYSRIVGYYRPLKNWNKGKREEYKARKLFSAGGIE